MYNMPGLQCNPAGEWRIGDRNRLIIIKYNIKEIKKKKK